MRAISVARAGAGTAETPTSAVSGSATATATAAAVPGGAPQLSLYPRLSSMLGGSVSPSNLKTTGIIFDADRASCSFQLSSGGLSTSSIASLPAYTLAKGINKDTPSTTPEFQRARRLQAVFEKTRATTTETEVMVYFDPTIFEKEAEEAEEVVSSAGVLSSNANEVFHLTSYQIYDKAAVKHPRNTTRFRQVGYQATYYADSDGQDFVSPIKVFTSIQCAPKLGEPSEQMYLYVEDGKLQNPEAYKAIMIEIFTNLLWAQEKNGVQVLVMPPIGGGVYLENLKDDAEKARARQLIHAAFAEAIARGNPETIAAWKFQEIIYTLPNPPGKKANETGSDYLAAVSSINAVLEDFARRPVSEQLGTPLISVRNVDALKAVQAISQTGSIPGLVIAGSSKCIGGHFDNPSCVNSMEESCYLVSDLRKITDDRALIRATPYPPVLQTRINAATEGMMGTAWAIAKAKIPALSKLEDNSPLSLLTSRLKVAFANLLLASIHSGHRIDLEARALVFLIAQLTQVYLAELAPDRRDHLLSSHIFLEDFRRGRCTVPLAAEHRLSMPSVETAVSGALVTRKGASLQEAYKSHLRSHLQRTISNIINEPGLIPDKQKNACVELFQGWALDYNRTDYFEILKPLIGDLVAKHVFHAEIVRAYEQAHQTLMSELRSKREASGPTGAVAYSTAVATNGIFSARSSKPSLVRGDECLPTLDAYICGAWQALLASGTIIPGPELARPVIDDAKAADATGITDSAFVRDKTPDGSIQEVALTLQQIMHEPTFTTPEIQTMVCQCLFRQWVREGEIAYLHAAMGLLFRGRFLAEHRFVEDMKSHLKSQYGLLAKTLSSLLVELNSSRVVDASAGAGTGASAGASAGAGTGASAGASAGAGAGAGAGALNSLWGWLRR